MKSPDNLKTQDVNLVTLVPSGFPRLKKMALLKLLAMPGLDAFVRSIKGGQKRGPGPGELIEALSFIHFARWVMLVKPWWRFGGQGLPRLDNQPKEKIKETVLLFTSNFNNDWGPYVETFMDASVDDLGGLWDQTPGWKPPTERGIEGFFEFVEEHTVASRHYFAAYPKTPTSDVKAALAVDRAALSFKAQMDTLHKRGTPLSDEHWCIAFDRMVASIQHNIGRIPEESVAGLFSESPSRFGVSHVDITSLSPFPKEAVGDLRGILDALPVGEQSPFAGAGGTHFGRFVIIEKVPNHDQIDTATGADQWIALESAYLLMSVDADGTAGGVDGWLRGMYASLGKATVDTIWSKAYGYPGAGDDTSFVKYIKRTMFPATVPFADYPRTSLWDIERSMKLHGAFTDMLFGTLGADCEARRAAFEAVMTP